LVDPEIELAYEAIKRIGHTPAADVCEGATEYAERFLE
jgi:hypothetical protein